MPPFSLPSPLAVTEPMPHRLAEAARALPRSELLRGLGELRTLCQDYRRLLEGIWDEDAPSEEARRLLDRHRTLAADAAGPFAVLGAAGALLDFVVERLPGEAVVFRVPGHAHKLAGLTGRADPGIVALSRALREVRPALDALTALFYEQAGPGLALGGARAQRMLAPFAALFRAIVRQDWADAELVLNHLNMVTTSRESHELVEQIGRLVRSIYDSLNEISRTVPVTALSNVTEEIPDAVDKLGSVIAELEAGANRNLDLLELLTAQVNEGERLVEAAQQALADCATELAALAEQHPTAAGALGEVREALRNETAAALAGGAERMREAHAVYMTLFANQSYQDLTGQTLKKVIAFIESLQFQLIQVISKQSGKPTVAAPVAAPHHTLEAGPDAHNRLSQDKVDSMLAELGF